MIPTEDRNSLLMLQTAYFIVSLIATSVTEDSRFRKRFSSDNLEHFEDFLRN